MVKSHYLCVYEYEWDTRQWTEYWVYDDECVGSGVCVDWLKRSIFVCMNMNGKLLSEY